MGMSSGSFGGKTPSLRLRCGASNGASDPDTADGNASGETGDSPPPWDLSARRRRIQEAAAKIVGDPFRDMVTSASRRFQDYMDKQKGSTAKEGVSAKSIDIEEPIIALVESEAVEEVKEETAWERWQKVFAEVEEKYSLLEGLQVGSWRAGLM